MRFIRCSFLALLALGVVVLGTHGQDDEVAQRQKKRAVENWKRAFESEPGIVHESQNFIFVAPNGTEENKVRALAEKMDGYFNSVKVALGGPSKKALWPGKMTVYLFTEKKNLSSLIRTVEKRRPATVGLGSFYLKGESTHLVACTPVEKEDPSQEQQALNQLFDAAFTRFGGDNHGIPEWLMLGFMDATAWENDAKRREKEVNEVKAVADHKKTPKNTKDLFANTLTGKELYLVRTSLASYLAYGPGQEKFTDMLRACKGERNQTKTIDEILGSIDNNQTKLNRQWLTWVRKGCKKEEAKKEETKKEDK
jgi:hypothetical protein